MIATVTKKRQVSLPAEICEQLDIKPGARLDFRVKRGRLEAVKVAAKARMLRTARTGPRRMRNRHAEELVIQKGCSCRVPEDFPQ